MLPDLDVLDVLEVVRLRERAQAEPEGSVVAAILELVAEVGQRQKNETRSVSALMAFVSSVRDTDRAGEAPQESGEGAAGG